VNSQHTINDALKGAEESVDKIQKENKAILNKLAPFKKIVEHLAAIGFSSIDDYMSVTEGGEITAIAFDDIKKKKLLAIKKVKEKTTISESKDGEVIYKNSQIEYELYDKPGSLQYLIKLRGDEPAEKHEHTGPEGGPIEFTRLDRANRIAAIAEAARKRKEGEDCPA
jgi:hypothetical protein